MWRLARSFELLDPLRKRIEAGLPPTAPAQA